MRPKMRIIAKTLCLCLALGLTSALGYVLGSGQPQPEPAPVEAPTEPAGPALRLRITEDPEADMTILSDESTEGTFARICLAPEISQVDIEVDGEVLPLEEALTTGRITKAEIACYARRDAENGYCTQSHKTKRGLTHFFYLYPDFHLRVVYDVYVTPDGGEDLINDLVIYPAREDAKFSVYTEFYDPETGRTDWEDWGLTFTAVEATATTVTVHCQQTGGQQIGQLSVDWFYLISPDVAIPDTGYTAERGQSPLCMGGETTFTLDWTEAYGELPPGKYRVTLNIRDHFDESQVHPLMQDFHDLQFYDVEFTIPST